MCTHKFSHLAAASFPQKCIIDLYFQSVANAAQTAHKQNVLPHDGQGRCIFHSRDIDWKLKNNFSTHLAKLLELVAEHYESSDLFKLGDNFRLVDLRECYFTGSQVNLPGDTTRELEIEDFNSETAALLCFAHSEFADVLRLTAMQVPNMDLDLKGCRFEAEVFMQGCAFNQATFNAAKFKAGYHINKCEFRDYFEFTDTQVNGNAMIINSSFQNVVYFTDSVFDTFYFGIENCSFGSLLDFSNCRFDSDCSIDDCNFVGELRFTDTVFREPFNFQRNYIEDNVLFASNDADNQMFNSLAHIYVEEEKLQGTLIFENVNFHNIYESDRRELIELSHAGHVTIGAGCIKYRHQSAKFTLQVQGNIAELALELANKFASFFRKSTRGNLGVEVVERTSDYIQLFYFSDENISEAEFTARLTNAEEELLNLVFPQGAQAEKTMRGIQTQGDRLNLFDSYVDLKSFKMKLALRVGSGELSISEAHHLFSVMQFSPDSLLPQAQFAGTINNHYTINASHLLLEGNMKVKVGINNGQMSFTESGDINNQLSSVERRQLESSIEALPQATKDELLALIRDMETDNDSEALEERSKVRLVDRLRAGGVRLAESLSASAVFEIVKGVLLGS